MLSWFKWKIRKYQSSRLKFKFSKQILRQRVKGKRYQWYMTWWSILKIKHPRLFKTNHWMDKWIFMRRDYRHITKIRLWKNVKKLFLEPELKLRWKLTRPFRGNRYFMKQYPKIKLLSFIYFNEYYWCTDTIFTIPFDTNDIFICALYYLFFYKDGLTGIELIAYGYIIEYVDFFHL